MAIYKTPDLNATCQQLLTEANELRDQLGAATSTPSKWASRIRRQAESDSYASSTRVEGFKISPSRADAITGGSSPGASEGEQAFAGYLEAMRFVEAAVDDDRFEMNRQMILALHFMACGFQRKVRPGRIRRKSIQVVDSSANVLYEGPEDSLLSSLVEEYVESLADLHRETDSFVIAALAHLNLVSLHPFEDGNGRLSRIVQSAVLATAGPVHPAFGSIEPYLADNTAAYYSVLREVQRGSYQPERSALPWVEFCLNAHVHQAKARIVQISAASTRWAALDDLVASRGWPERLVIALELSLTIGLERAAYAEEAEIAVPTAASDLRRLADAGLVEAHGAGRSTRYRASDELKRIV